MNNELEVRCLLSRKVLPALESEQAVYGLVELKSGSGGPPAVAASANLALVLDRSGSMDGEKIERMKEAVGHVLDLLRDDDLVSVVLFDDQVDVPVAAQAAGNRDEIKKRIESVIARGGTQISDGLKAGLREIEKGFSPERVNKILLLTDGRTWDDENACLALADEAAGQGIAITTLGLGEEWNEKLLLGISERSQGNSQWIRDPAAMRETFREEVRGMQSSSVVNLQLTARASRGVHPVKVYTTIPLIADISSRTVRENAVIAPLGSLDATQGQTILIEMRTTQRKPGTIRLGQIELVYDMPELGIRQKKTVTDLVVTIAADPAAASRVNAEVMNLVEKLSAFKLQTRALTELAAGNLAAATQKLRSAATVLLNLGEDELATVINGEVTLLGKTGSLSAAATKKLEYGTRKLTRALS